MIDLWLLDSNIFFRLSINFDCNTANFTFDWLDYTVLLFKILL